MKQIVKLSGLLMAFALLLCSSHLLAEGDKTDAPNKEVNAQWIQYSHPKDKLVKDGITIGGGGEISETGGNLVIDFNFNWVFVKCCKYIDEKYSWCDRALTDKRC